MPESTGVSASAFPWGEDPGAALYHGVVLAVEDMDERTLAAIARQSVMQAIVQAPGLGMYPQRGQSADDFARLIGQWVYKKAVEVDSVFVEKFGAAVRA